MMARRAEQERGIDLYAVPGCRAHVAYAKADHVAIKARGSVEVGHHEQRWPRPSGPVTNPAGCSGDSNGVGASSAPYVSSSGAPHGSRKRASPATRRERVSVSEAIS